jgi:hypothetical protein
MIDKRVAQFRSVDPLAFTFVQRDELEIAAIQSGKIIATIHKIAPKKYEVRIGSEVLHTSKLGNAKRYCRTNLTYRSLEAPKKSPPS